MSSLDANLHLWYLNASFEGGMIAGNSCFRIAHLRMAAWTRRNEGRLDWPGLNDYWSVLESYASIAVTGMTGRRRAIESHRSDFGASRVQD